MYKYFILFTKGFLIGVGKIIPGVSGAVLAISFGVYEKSIKAVSNFFNNTSQNFKFLGTLGVGVLMAIILVSNLIKYSLDTYYLPTMLLFVGLIIGGLPLLFSKISDSSNTPKNVTITLIVFLVVILLSFLNNDNEIIFTNNLASFLLLIIIGTIEAATMIIPGISGTAVLMLIGCYDTIINTLSSLTNLNLVLDNLRILIPFGIGIFIGTIVIIKLMSYLFNNHELKTYYAIIGFALSSVFLMLFQTFGVDYEMNQIIIGLFLLLLGYNLSRRLDT